MAGVYDFHTLSHLDFEELARDLLQAEWGGALESFGPGRDQGIDMRYLQGQAATIIQSKHLLGSGFPGLLTAMKAEREKVLRLAPTRYVVTTSVPLTPARKAEIVAAMAGVPLTPTDILGQEDLNNLIRKHPAIERRHFKLWLSSTAILERILLSGVYNRTAAEMDIIQAMVPRFVLNPSVSAAERKLAETGALIIAGPPGVGKTTLARILLWLHAEQGWKIFVVDSIEEAFRVADPCEKRLILLDDFLGQVRLSADHVRGIDARLPPLISRVAAHENLRFVLTTRDYILAEARELSQRLGPGQINAREYVLNVGQYTRAVKARILYNHLYFSELAPVQLAEVLADDFFLEIIDHKNFNPRLIDEMTKQDYLTLTERPARETIHEVLDNPELLWEIPYRQHISAAGRMMMLALFINGGTTSVEPLKATYVRVSRALGASLHSADVEASFRSTFKILEGSVLAVMNRLVMFANPGLRDFLQSAVAKDRLVPLLLAHVETPRELRELWAVFRAQSPSDEETARLADAWIAAYDRAEESGLSDCYDSVELAADLAGVLAYPPMNERLENALTAFEEAAIGIDEVSQICALLETSYVTELAWHIEGRLREAITRTAARLLVDYADELSFEDIQSLDEALHDYGSDKTLVGGASRVAMESLARHVDSEIGNIETVEELDEFEDNLLGLMRKRAFAIDRVVSDIQYRRDRLYEDGQVERRSSYFSSSSRSTAATDDSDRDIRSMFRGLVSK